MDKFDDIWRNSFNEGQQPEESWNTPDEDLWEGIATELPIPKDRRRKLLWWWSMGLILVSLLGFFWWSGGNEGEELISSSVQNWSFENHLESASIEHQDQLTGVQENQSLEIPGQDSPSTTTVVEEPVYEMSKTSKANSTVPVSTPISTINSSSTKGESTKALSPGVAASTTTANTDLKSTTEELPSLSPASAPMATEITPLATPSTSLDHLPLLHNELPPLTYELENLTPIIPEDKTSPAFRFTDLAGAVYWKHRISDQYQSDLAAFDFNYTDQWGWYTGVQAAWDWNEHLSLFAGIQYERIRVNSGHNSNLIYNPDDETNASASNDYTLNLATPYGATEAQFRFNREQMDQPALTDPVDLLVDFKSQHLIENLNIPIGLQLFPLGRRGRFTPSATVGLGINYLLDLENNIESIDTHHDLIRYDEVKRSTTLQTQLQNWHLDYRLGLALNYKLLPNLQLALMGDWTSGVHAIFSQNDYETRVDRYHLSLGLVKTFGAKSP